jgi:putative ABC transport system permease protein
VTPDYFATLGVQPIVGRVFDAAEGEGRGRVAMLRDDFWKTTLGADPAILQKGILIDGQFTSVIGILPAAFRFPSSDSVIWMPLVPVGQERNRGFHAFSMVGRLKPGVTLSQAQADLEIVMNRLAREYPDQDGGHGAKVVRLQDWSLDKRIRDRLVFLQIAALALFLMACANVSSLLLARYSARRAEFGVRVALGTSRMRQMRQHLAESLLLTALGCMAAVGLAWAGVRFLVWLYGEQMPRASEISPDWKLVGAVAAATIGGAVAIGFTTALHERRKGPRPEGSRTTSDRKGVHTRKTLVVFQIACAVLLLAATGEVLQSFRTLMRTDVGFDRTHLITMRVSLPSAKYREGTEIGGFFERTAGEMSSMPGVRTAAAINMLPIAEWGFNGSVNVEGLPPLDRSFFAEYRWITSDYFSAMAIPLLRGRLFLPEEMSGKNKAAIVNETMARKVWGEKDPLGAHIGIFSPEWITVVGVARDVRQTSVSASPSPEVYMPAKSYSSGRPIWSIVIRSELPADSLVPGIRRAIHAEEAQAAVDHIETMDEVVADSVSAQRIVATLLLCFAALALILAGLGLYSLVTFTAAARLPELAIRGALGASPGALIGLVGFEGIALVAAGIITGLAAVIPLRPLIAKYVFEVSSISVPALGLVLLILLAVGGVAVLVPALRAVRVDPIQALRRE